MAKTSCRKCHKAFATVFKFLSNMYVRYLLHYYHITCKALEWYALILEIREMVRVVDDIYNLPKIGGKFYNW